MALYFKRYEISVMKDCLPESFRSGKADLDLSLFQSFFDRHSKLDIEKLTSSSTIEEFVNNLQGSEYYGPLSKLGRAIIRQHFLITAWPWTSIILPISGR